VGKTVAWYLSGLGCLFILDVNCGKYFHCSINDMDPKKGRSPAAFAFEAGGLVASVNYYVASLGYNTCITETCSCWFSLC